MTELRLAASVLVVISLGFFFCLALRSRREAQLGWARCSAQLNLLASLLVLLAALLRLGEQLEGT